VITISSPCSTRSRSALSRFFASNAPTSRIKAPKLDSDLAYLLSVRLSIPPCV
jgi:hypothetical protein